MLKKSVRYCMIVLVIASLNSIAYAKEKHFVRIVNASTNTDTEILYINGENFGENPEIRLDDDILSIQFKSDNYIEALLPNGIEAGTYRLVVDKKKKQKKGKHHMFPIWQFIAAPGYRDKIDITIGITGPEGSIGETGLQGPKGDRGNTGPQGITGRIGLQGLTGPVGPQGLKGITGLQGPAGLKGNIGEIGPQGLTGPIGSQGLRGETGVQGPAGLKGDQGDTGPQGLAGPIGSQGLRGETGLQGPAGLKGDQGDTGPQGLSGPIGPQGETGLQGPTGLQGDKGDTGPQGLTGPVGPQGPTGSTGPQGPAGSKGNNGDKGDPGISGYGIVSKSGSATLLSFGGNAAVLSVSCPSGKKVLGGGGKSNYNGNLLSESYPNPAGNGWSIKYSNQSAYTKTISLSVYAICAECQ